MTELTKDEAREETLRRWRALPAEERRDFKDAEVLSFALAEQLDFRTMGNSRKIILSWLTHELAGLPPWGNIPPESFVAANNDHVAEPQQPKAVVGRRRRRR